jgi:hypothetical protein
MNTIRMFAFAAAVLFMAFLLRLIANVFLYEQPIHTAITAPDVAASAGHKSVGDRDLP